MKMTKIFFGSFGAPPYPGARQEIVAAEEAVSWHVVVGGAAANLTPENIGRHMPHFLQLAYNAGVRDEKKRITELLDVST